MRLLRAWQFHLLLNSLDVSPAPLLGKSGSGTRSVAPKNGCLTITNTPALFSDPENFDGDSSRGEFQVAQALAGQLQEVGFASVEWWAGKDAAGVSLHLVGGLSVLLYHQNLTNIDPRLGLAAYWGYMRIEA